MVPHTRNSTLPAEIDEIGLLAGTRISHYEIVAAVGGGGMGVVYKARDLKLGRSVALKFLPRQFHRDDMARQRLIAEARIASALDHRNICTIHNIDWTADGQLFIVMAYYEGKTLKQRLEEGVLPIAQALNVAGQIADGLAYLHGRTIVHCDIKPSNVMVTDDGIKILDFGLAHAPNAPQCALPGSTTPGTAVYMAPEQARGQQGDARSDIWALGVVLFEMLTGRVPFAGAYPEAISYAIRHDSPAAMRVAETSIPAAVERLVLQLLEKNPDRRYQNASELASQLRALEMQLTRTDVETSTTGRFDMIGRTVSHYQITGRLGIGGMGVVYEAHDTRTPRQVALKFVSGDRVSDFDAVRRLKREAETMAMLDHPHICSVYEIDEHNGQVYIAMERLEGTNLKLHILKKMLRTSEIVDVALQITEALEAAHGVGIVHRDIKPGNVFVGKSGVVKVLDFGLARRFSAADTEEMRDGSTIPGRPLGTANYMAPERILQMSVDPRSDLFSLGVVMYEMATERLPFGGASPSETVFNVLTNDPTPLRKLCPQRPVALQRIVNKLLAKRPDLRYQSAAELRKALLAMRPVRKRTLVGHHAPSTLEFVGGHREAVCLRTA
jgi:serine/threonine protein kinase